MATRGRPRDFDRDEALRQAMQVFWERGYEGTSLSELTAAMGIKAPSLYAAFGSKEALFREAVRLYDSAEGGATNRALKEAPTARAAVEAMLRDNVKEYVSPGSPPGCMIVLAGVAGTTENAEVREFLAELRRGAITAIQRRLDRGIADGELPAGTDTLAMAAFYVTVLHGLSIQSRDGATLEMMTAIVDCAMAAWDTLVKPRKKR
ncbi:TetR/AcrR family transcriptional regulator [Pyxidicoccus sp. 3LG]